MASVVVIGGGMSLLHAVQDCLKQKCKVTAILGNPFLEWNLAACHFLVKSERHMEFVCPNPDDYKLKGVDYIFDVVTNVDPKARKVTTAKGTEVSYDYLVVATGSKLPLIIATPGHTLDQRVEQVEGCAKAIKDARTVVINGAGAIGLEMAGDVRAAYPDKKVIVISRDGKVIPAQPPAWQQRIEGVLKNMNIEVVTGTADGNVLDYKMESGTLEVKNGSSTQKIEYDVYIPCFQQGPNTTFLREADGVLSDRGHIKVNDFLQSTVHPEIFAIGVGDKCPMNGTLSMQLTEQSATVAKNIKQQISGKPLFAHKPSQNKDAQPVTIKVGHGPGAYVYLDAQQLPPPVKCCCCVWCKGGFPFCPPPCCWCCCTGCSRACGSCCGDAEGEGPAIFFLETGNKKFPGMHGFKGMGAKPQQQKM